MKLHRWTFTLVLLTLFASCSQQGEGERCVISNGNNDCGSNLRCTPAEELESEANSDYGADRCCPKDLARSWSDPRCKPVDTSDDLDGTGGTAGVAGQVNGAGTSAAGTAGQAGGAGGGAGTAGASTAGSAGDNADAAAGNAGEPAGTAGSGTAGSSA